VADTDRRSRELRKNVVMVRAVMVGLST